MDGYRLAVEATTVVRSSCPSYSYVNHGNPGTRRFAIDDPKGFLKTNPCPLIVDEVQRVPELLSWIQVTIDERPGKGLFIPTGSSQPGLGAAVSQSLAGRTSLMHLLPLSLEELSLAGSRPDRNTCLVKGFLPRMYQENQPAPQAARAPLLGGMFENMVVVELIKSLWNRGKRDSLYFYRDSVGTRSTSSSSDSVSPRRLR